jgi:hypothetical protein
LLNMHNVFSFDKSHMKPEQMDVATLG